MKKTCTKCGHAKDLEDFVKNSRRKDSRGSWCLVCCRAFKKEKRREYGESARRWRGENRERTRAYFRRSNDCHREFLDDMKKGRSCIDCGENHPSPCMEFDHVRGEKVAGVSSMINWRREAVLKEAAKCDLVCVNCHRVRTDERRTPTANSRTSSFRAWIDGLKAGPCMDCGKKFPSVAMDFDHVHGTKVARISSMWSWSKDRVLGELEKCELVCANCHRGRTCKRDEKSRRRAA